MNTHETYVSLETAKLLKECGFDWEVKFFYRDGILRNVLPDELFNGDFEDVEYYYKHIGILHQSLNYNDGSSKFLEEYSAPTLDVAQRWLREVKGYYVVWEFNMNISSWGQELYDFTDISVYIFVASEQGNICKCKLKENYKTIEESQEAGIKKAIEIILEKGE